ncbi:MAG: methionyl-tRNA formyltransferase [Candidatus Azambacteria bacterium]|nr:methionyl-tRNA formyltransferase [Candidatus Azambacteria bacterium]
MIKFVFFGTPEFATIILEKLIKSGLGPQAVFRDPKESVSVLIEKLEYLKPDLAVIAAYGKILPKEILEIPRYGFINVHPSLLPKYRGASPIQYAILNGDKETGVTIMKVDEEMDRGPLLANNSLGVANSDTYESLSKKLAELGAELLVKTIPDYISGKIKPIPQDHSKATYTKIIKKEDGKIDWSKSAEIIERMIRAYYPWPSAYAKLKVKSEKFKIVKIIEAEICKENNHTIGEVFLTENNQLAIKCGAGSLVIKKLQLEGGKVLTAKEFLNGHKNFVGSILE